MKKSKKFSFIILAVLLLIRCTSSTEPTSSKETVPTMALISNYLWQLQNPTPTTNSAILLFHEDGTMELHLSKLLTGERLLYFGTYTLSENKLSISFNQGEKSEFILNWVTKNEISLSSGSKILYYAKANSSEDQFNQNLLRNASTISNPYPNEYQDQQGENEVTKPSIPEICQVCRGLGKCKTCDGMGYYSMYGHTSTCSACGGNKKCWHCKGTGREN